MKSREAILNSRWLRPVAHLFSHPSLWHLNRRSVPRALALGLFAAFILPLGQFALAALLALVIRANVPLAAATTLVTNPLTFPPIYYAAYRLGSAVLGNAGGNAGSDAANSIGEKLLSVSGPTALGLVIFAIVGALLGYALGSAWWQLKIIQRWRGRQSQGSR